MRTKSLVPSKRCLNKSLQEISTEAKDSDQKVVFKAISQLVLEDDDCFINLISKIQTKTGLDRKAISEVLKKARLNEEISKKISIDAIAENLE